MPAERPTHRAPTPEEIAAIEQSPEFQERQRAHLAREAISQAAVTVPLPGAMADAFPSGPVTAAGFTLVDMTPGHRILLEQVNSPFIRQLRELAKDPEDRQPVEYSDAEVFEALFILTRVPRESRQIIAQGPQVFRDHVLTLTADTISMRQAAEIVPAIIEVFRRAFAPQVEIEEAATEGGTENFPSAAPSAPTASAGGLRSSPAPRAISTPAATSTGSSTTSRSGAASSVPRGPSSTSRVPSGLP